MADITPKEFALATPDVQSDAAHLKFFEFGFDIQDPAFTIIPEPIISRVLFGYPKLAIPGLGEVDPPSILVKVIFGEPQLSNPPAPAVNPVLVVGQPLGAAIGTQTLWKATLSLNTTDGTVTRIVIEVAFPGGIYETVYINGAFTPNYNGQSVLAESPAGVFAIAIIRNGGWPGSPRVFVHANTDRGGMTQ